LPWSTDKSAFKTAEPIDALNTAPSQWDKMNTLTKISDHADAPENLIIGEIGYAASLSIRPVWRSCR